MALESVSTGGEEKNAGGAASVPPETGAPLLSILQKITVSRMR